MPDTSNLNSDTVRDFVQSALKNCGFDVVTIPVSAHKTPDLALLLAEGRILIEVKSKDDDKQLRGLVESPNGTRLSYKISTIESLLKRAWHQIRDFPSRSDKDFAVLWLVAARPGLTAFTRPAAMTVLYGVQNMEGLIEESGSFYAKECFFFGNSFFFRRKEVDGVVLHDDRQVTLCLNPLSKRHDEFRRTTFAELFRRDLELIDPKASEEAGKCFIADCDLPRKDINSIVRYLKRKYGLESVTLIRFVLVNYPAE
ncbi:hypothetical protein [Longimicrobium sp.]|uniref:hypothetical protein n=1 Tax=Longimicrobium sp. TaxID=2029185 RepID=UPI003B3A8C91